jgi:hypothetical protein
MEPQHEGRHDKHPPTDAKQSANQPRHETCEGQAQEIGDIHVTYYMLCSKRVTCACFYPSFQVAPDLLFTGNQQVTMSTGRPHG